MTAVVVLAISPDTAVHLVAALQGHRAVCRSAGLAPPPDLRALEEFFASQRQVPPRLDAAESAGDVDPVSVRLVDYATAAKLLGVGRRTVDRLVASGALVPVRILGSARLRVADIDSLIESAPNARRA